MRRSGRFRLTLAVVACLSLLPLGWENESVLSRLFAAEKRVSLRVLAEVKAERKRVSLLDLCDPAGLDERLADLLKKSDIGEAPDPGSEKIINPEQLRAFLQQYLASNAYDSSLAEISLPEKIVIRRASIQIPKEQIEEIYKEHILANAPWSPQEVSIREIYFPGALELPAGKMTYEVQANNSREKYAGNVILTIQFFVDGEKERSLRVAGKVDVMRDVLHAVRLVKRNEVLTDADLDVQRLNIAEAPDRYAENLDQAVGKRVLRDIRARQPVLLSDLDEPPALKRGSAVTIVYDQPGLKLTAKGQTREDGSVGATVRVVNLMTKRTVSCLVIDSTTVQALP